MPDRYLGQLLGKYRATRLLGTGSFSWVYEAVDTESGATVALKILRPEYAGHQDSETRFRIEAETAARLRHPNIVVVRDVGQSGDTAYVAMDLLPLTLARRLELVHRLPEVEVVRLALDIASALALAHSMGVVHRDIKPDNILLNDNGQAIVGDFGLARAIAADPSLSASQQVMGTPHYFSPEQARGHAVDGRSDLYALGVTLFRASTGKLPYEGDDWYSVARQHIEAPVPAVREMIPELTPGFDAIILRLLSKRPEQRFASATLLIDALAQLPTAPERVETRAGSGSADATMIAPVPLSATARARRRKWVTRGGAASGLIAAATTLLVLNRNSLPSSLGNVLGVRDSVTAPMAPAFSPNDTGRTTDTLPTNNATPAGVNSNPGSRRTQDSIAAARNPRGTPSTRRAQVEVATDPDATVYVDNVAVGFGSRTVEIPVNKPVKLRAVFQDAKPECRTAVRDSSVQLASGKTRVALDVRPCGSVTFYVTPRSAYITLRSEVDGARYVIPADTGSLLLPAGRYALDATAVGYEKYGPDFVVIPRNGAPARKRFVMFRSGNPTGTSAR